MSFFSLSPPPHFPITPAIFWNPHGFSVGSGREGTSSQILALMASFGTAEHNRFSRIFSSRKKKKGNKTKKKRTSFRVAESRGIFRIVGQVFLSGTLKKKTRVETAQNYPREETIAFSDRTRSRLA